MKTCLKQILFLLIIGSFFFSCEEERIVASTITVVGNVTDENDIPIDNVEVSLNISYFMYSSIPIENTYTNEKGEFTIVCSPGKVKSTGGYWHHSLTFAKEGYVDVSVDQSEYSIDLYKSHQTCKIVLKHEKS
jgi:hypothetical protein